ncbi:AAA family ATPase [Sphingomonas paucimobilis]|uniref:AAA family ATPase n=1 Tax=Sphingomonas paucimobilis TaxID=13689 RepID=A0A7T3E5Q9_SPHPI|nr:AAA family ATPase [Sphingomonas paucimobilis]QPT08609.1 AAA family ATPase [Sphingomonas paucimobilis]
MINPNAQPIDIAEQQTWLADHKKERSLSWSQLSAKIGVAQSTLSMFPGGGYKGDNAPIAQAVFKYRQYLKSQADVAVEMREPPAFYPTPTGKRIQTMLSIAQRGRIVVIAGAPGTSKTKAIQNYRASISNVWISTMSPSTAGVNTMQQEVLESFGEADAKGTPRALSKKIVSFVKDTGGLIVIDEAQHTSELALEEIRSWHDRTGIGIALVGNEDVLTRLTLGSKADAFARLASRVAQRYIFRGPQDGDALALADAWDVHDDEQRAFIVGIAKQPGGLRTCTMMMETACMLAASENNELTLEHLRDAWSHLAIRQAGV